MNLTPWQQAFLVPKNSLHRQYEALRAYFVENLPSKLAAEKFGYTPGSFRVLCHAFRKNPGRPFFLSATAPDGPALRQRHGRREKIREKVLALRKQNLSVYDIARVLAGEGIPYSSIAVWKILHAEGFARLPRRRDEERPLLGKRPEKAEVADCRQLNWEARTFQSSFGGLFLFLPMLVRAGFDQVIHKAALPGSQMIPSACAWRSLLALKLFGKARHSHVMSYVLDEGLGFFAGLNVIPKRSFLTEYSCRIRPACYQTLMRHWFDAASTLGLERGESFDLDFHTIPHHGEDALLQKHYVSKRSRRQKGLLAFLAQDEGQRVFCYANAEIRKENQNDEILRFVDFWEQRTGHMPKELVFDSKLTTYGNLARLNEKGILFITLRRRTEKMLRELGAVSPSAWRRIELDGVSRVYRTPKILDQRIALKDYTGPIRQIAITELGHEEPTLLLTNQLEKSAKMLVERYAQRMIIENGIADSIDFFHMDALSSTVPMKVSCDLQLTLMGSSLYRLLGTQLGNGYQTAKSSHIFRDLIDASATITLDEKSVLVRFGKRAHNPLLLNAGFDKINLPVPWWGGRRLQFAFG